MSSDHRSFVRLLAESGGDAVDDELRRSETALLVRGVVYADEFEFDAADSTRRGMRTFVRYEVKLSFRLRTEDVTLSFLGRYEGSGC